MVKIVVIKLIQDVILKLGSLVKALVIVLFLGEPFANFYLIL